MSYDADPSTAQRPLNIHEVEQLVASGGKPLLKNAKGLRHFLERVRLTIRSYQEQMQRLHRQMQQAQLAQDHAGAPTTLHPIDSFRYLSEAEKKRVMDSHLEEKYDALLAELNAAKAARARVNKVVNGLEFQFGGILDEPSVPQRIKDQVRALMSQAEQLPSEQELTAPGSDSRPAAPAPPPVPGPAVTPSPAEAGPATPPVADAEGSADGGDAIDELFDDWLS